MLTRRKFTGAAGAALGFALLSDPLAAQSVAFDAVVLKPGRQASLLSGMADHGQVFPDIASALAVARQSTVMPFRIYIGPGVWRERLILDRPGIALFGAGAHHTIITGGFYAGMKGKDGKQIGTFRTATVQVTVSDFSARRLTISNDYDYDRAARDHDGNGAQAVALALQDKADRSYLEDVVVTGHQDTLFVNSGRSLFKGCRILGCVDFIFGAGRAFFEDCHIVSLNRPGADFNGYIAAPDTDRHQPVGLVFFGCHLHKGVDVSAHSVALGRAWRHSVRFADGYYGDPDNVGACAYISCWMDDHIVPEGWRPMGYNKKDGTRAELTPEEVRFFEYDSRGPGAGKPSSTRRMLTKADLTRFSKAAVLPDWPV